MSASKLPVDQAVEQPEPAAIHQRFSFLYDAVQQNTEAQFAEKTMNICQGISTCLGLIQSDDLRRIAGIQPLLDGNATDRLLRFVMTSADLLAEDAGASIDRMNSNSFEGGKQ